MSSKCEEIFNENTIGIFRSENPEVLQLWTTLF